MGDHAEGGDGGVDEDGNGVDEGDDVGKGGGINPASISNVCHSGSSPFCFATRAVAILHSLGYGCAGAGAGTAIGAVDCTCCEVFGGGGADFGSGGVAFGCRATSAPDGGFDRCLRSGVSVDSIPKPLLMWPGEGVKR